ncbi:MAG: sulfatase [Fuerstiella sp.]|nr:sulfatase [Fuerstiella sp.]MCP4856851.1 sulfatase [Fuerstiella sp.]
MLFIAVDDLRPSIRCYGDPHAITPNIDRLAERGVRFDRAHCQVAVCNPSRASLMTGLRPDKLGVWTLPIHFREAMPAAVTLPQWFRRFGYTAVSHGKIYHNPTPDPQSWSEAIRASPRLKSAYPEGTQQRIREVQKALPQNDWRKNNLRGPSTAAPDVDDSKLVDGARTDMAIEDLRRLGSSDAPFFLAMGYIRPHLAWIAPKKYWDLHDPATLPAVTNGSVTANTPPYALSNSYELTHYVDLFDFPKPWDEQRVADERARHLMHAYYACVTYIDSQIGRLLDALDEEGLAENTIVVLWSDHGWKLGEFNGWGKMTNYEIDTRIPLIISAPGLPTAGQQSDELAELLDLYPTLCELAGLDIPDFVDGNSLVPNLKDVSVHVNAAAFSQYYRNFEGREYMGYAIRTDKHRFVEWRDFSTGEVTARELFDHQSDHSESVNLADSAPQELIDRLTAELLESHPRKVLTMTPPVHSNPNQLRLRADISFLNKSETTVMVFPITPKGRRGRVKNLSPGESVTIKARIGGVYVVESKDGTIHQIHSPSMPSRTIVLE